MCERKGCRCGRERHTELLDDHQQILHVARRNRWTLTYLAFVTTALLILMILEATGRL